METISGCYKSDKGDTNTWYVILQATGLHHDFRNWIPKALWHLHLAEIPSLSMIDVCLRAIKALQPRLLATQVENE